MAPGCTELGHSGNERILLTIHGAHGSMSGDYSSPIWSSYWDLYEHLGINIHTLLHQGFVESVSWHNITITRT